MSDYQGRALRFFRPKVLCEFLSDETNKKH